ncbi:MAG: threonine dehydratase [Burkholderiales bacterium]|nr:threonine dehydratase [Burkholderiales bacterium]
MTDLPTLAQLDAAARTVYEAMLPTPQYRWPLLSEALGTELWVKHENHTPVGAFKVRGGLVYFADLAAGANRPAGVVSATRGNHGQSIALAAARHGIASTIVVPHGNSVEKNAAMRALRATLVEHGDDFQAAREHAVRLAQENGWHMVPSFHPLLVRGVGTWSLEMLRAVPGLDVVYVPIGLGSGICGMIAAREALGLKTTIVGVVSSHAPAYALSFAQRQALSHPVSTLIGDGMACSTPEQPALEWIWRHVERIVQVSDDELRAAMRLLFRTTHNTAEGAGAAGLAAAWQERERLRGRKVGVVLSGANVDSEVFGAVLLR